MLAIYCRTSKVKEDGRDYSIESQKQGGIKLAQELGMPFKFYVDEGISGTLDVEVRPSFADMMADITNEKIQAIYCIDQSRIERNTNTWRFFVAECINNKCLYYPNGRELDLTDADSMLFANLLSLVNSYYAEITSKKVKLANYNKAKIGKTHGSKAFGYLRDKENNYVVFEEEAVHVRRMFELSLQGIGTYTIANILNEEGVATKFNRFKGKITRTDKYTKRETHYDKSNVMWRGNVIYDMLKNEIYKGIRVWHDLRVSVPSVVSVELWDMVNANLVKNKKNVGKRAEYNYLLNHLVYCSHCQNEMLGKKRLKGNDNSYKCKGKRPPHKNCNASRAISLPKLETFIIHHLFNSKELKQMLIESPKNASESLQLKNKKREKEKEKVELQQSVDRLAKLLKNPKLKDDENFVLDYLDYKDKLKETIDEIDSLTIKISEAENAIRNQRSKTVIEQYTSDAGFIEVKKLIHSLIDRIEIYHQKEEKSGYFTIKVKYRYYDETSIFTTNWQAMKWNWDLHYRKEALNASDLDEDIGLANYLLKKANQKPLSRKGFKGVETVSSKHLSIVLKNEELIKFDYTT